MARHPNWDFWYANKPYGWQPQEQKLCSTLCSKGGDFTNGRTFPPMAIEANVRT
jgi:hypothetical protein